MEAMVDNAQNLHNVGSFKPPHTIVAHGSNEDDTATEICSGPIFGLDDLEVDEVNQLVCSDDIMMIFDEEVSSGSQHSTFKPKKKKKK